MFLWTTIATWESFSVWAPTDKYQIVRNSCFSVFIFDLDNHCLLSIVSFYTYNCFDRIYLSNEDYSDISQSYGVLNFYRFFPNWLHNNHSELLIEWRDLRGVCCSSAIKIQLFDIPRYHFKAMIRAFLSNYSFFEKQILI